MQAWITFFGRLFKQDLGIGEAIMVLPHATGSLPVRIKFKRSFALDKPMIPKLKKSAPAGMPTATDEKQKNEQTEAVNDLLTKAAHQQKEAA